MASKKIDMVNSPPHYKQGAIECIDAIRSRLGDEGFRAFCLGMSMRYVWRAGLKFNAPEDLEKAIWYTRMANDDDPRKDGSPPTFVRPFEIKDKDKLESLPESSEDEVARHVPLLGRVDPEPGKNPSARCTSRSALRKSKPVLP